MSLILIAAMTLLYATGSVLLANAAKSNSPISLAAAYVAYMAGNLAYLILLKSHGFGAIATLSSAALIVASVIAGKVFFGEAITLRTGLGLIFAVVAVLLVAPPSIWRL